MKKVILAGLLSLLVLTGCGKKETVVCTNNQKVSGIDLNSTVNVYLENSKFKGLDMEIDIVVPDSMMSAKDTLVKALEKQYQSFETKYGVTPKTTGTEKGAKVTMEMTAEQAKEFSGSNNDKATRKDVIEIFGKQGFECK
jgi:hypothetical protein